MVKKKMRLRANLVYTQNGVPDIDETSLKLLEAVNRFGSLVEACRYVGMSYRSAWSHLRILGTVCGSPVVRSSRGGSGGGGSVTLTPVGGGLLREYRRISQGISRVMKEDGFWESLGLKISTRNVLKGKVKEVKKDMVASTVKIVVPGPVEVTATITREAADDLELKVGDYVHALVKSTEVIVAKE